jgi:outer membrane protein OmpA-like peptidoglycan-associated protein
MTKQNLPRFNQLSIILLIFSCSSAAFASPECDSATDLLFRAYYLHSQGKAVPEQKLLFTKSLRLCPERSIVHTTLANILEEQGQYAKAAEFYKQALRYDKKFYKAWYGLGEAYYKQNRFPLSLEAHLQACQHEKGSKARVKALLNQKSYAFTKTTGDFLDRESLLVLYDEERQKSLNQMISDCGLSRIDASQDCKLATDLLFHAYYLQSQGKGVSQQKDLFTKSLQLCPDRPDVHSTLAALSEKQGEYTEAVHSYKQAIKYDKDFNKAWYGLGETYYKQKRFPLSLETHLHLCQTNQASKARVKELLEDKRYAYTKKGEIIDQESLQVLYDEKRRQRLNQKISECGLPDFEEVQPIHTFINFEFELGSARLSLKSTNQLDEIAVALQHLKSPTIIIHGHTDSKPFQSATSPVNSDKLNLKLSADRAANVRAAMVRRGISREHIRTQAHGDKVPILAAFRAENRRVEIEVR